MKNIITIQGINCYEENGTAYLNLEAVARGLGFTETAASGNECIRWRTVRKYLAELGIATFCDEKLPAYIPENIFYRLAMRAKNEAAERFQALIADEVIPAIRKTGVYVAPSVDSGMLFKIAQAMQEQEQKIAALEQQTEQMKPKALFADAVSASKTSILVGDLSKLLKQNGVEIGQKRLFQYLRDNGYLIKQAGASWNMPTQYSMERGLFEVKETSVTHADGHITISKTPKVTGKGQLFFVNQFLQSN